MESYHIFETAKGFMAIAWNSEDAICALLLPFRQGQDLRNYLKDAWQGRCEVQEPPHRLAAMIQDIRRYFAGEIKELPSLPLSLEGQSPFRKEVYRFLQGLPLGKTIAYGELAAELGRPKGARAVGSAMAKNPIPLLIPCHRVLLASKKIGHFTGDWGPELKAWMLHHEGAL